MTSDLIPAANTNPLALWQQIFARQAEFMRAYSETWQHFMSWPGMSTGDINIYFPFGRDYHQTIEPNTNWGFIDKSETDFPEVEKEILRDVASYGKQVGRLMDVVVDLGEKSDSVDAEALAELKELKARIDAVKAKHGIS